MRYLAEERQWEEREFNKAVEHLEHKYFIEIVASDCHSRITAYGIQEVEDVGIAPAELREESGMMRTRIMDRLGRAWDENGPHHHVDVDELLAACGADYEGIDTCLQLLKELGHIEDVTVRTYRITAAGHERVQKWRRKVSLAEEFANLSDLAPQVRGRQFQKLLARFLGEHGWQQEEGIRTSNEEMDIIIHREREYYLIECKWETEPIETAVIRDLYGKLSHRKGIGGIVFSLSGFTRGAVKEAQDCTGDRVILLFGKEDVLKLIGQAASFDELLSRKYDELIKRRRVIFE